MDSIHQEEEEVENGDNLRSFHFSLLNNLVKKNKVSKEDQMLLKMKLITFFVIYG